MRTIIEKVNVFKFSELAPSIQDRVIQDWNNDRNYNWSGEWVESLTEFCSVLSIRLNSWEFGPYRQGYINWSYDALENIEPCDLSGLRLRIWLINNFLPALQKSKFYSINKAGKLKTRHSKIQFTYDCNLTGVYSDYSLIQPILEFIKKPDASNLDDVIYSCFHSFLRDYQNDIEYQDSKAYITESIDSNDYEFLKDGTIYS